MKYILVIIAIMSITSCGYVDRRVASATGFARTCVDGVSYIQFTSGASVAYNTDGTIKTCK